MVENWVPVVIWKNGVKHDYTGVYEVSNQGEVRRVPHYVSHNYGGLSLKKSREKTIVHSKSGYCVVMLYHNGTTQNCRLHRVVWESFNGPVPQGMQINHINEDKADNRLENLNLMSPKENSNWGTRTKRLARTLSVPINQYSLDGCLIRTWQSATEIERSTGFSHQNIQKCASGKTKTAYKYVWRYAS